MLSFNLLKLLLSHLKLSFQDLGLSSPLLKHMWETTLYGKGPVWGMGQRPHPLPPLLLGKEIYLLYTLGNTHQKAMS